MSYIVKQKLGPIGRVRRALGVLMTGTGLKVYGAHPYKGGEVNRLNKTWQPNHYSGDGAVAEDWELLTARIRDLGRNDPAIRSLKRALLDHVVSTGIGTTANVTVAGELVEDFNAESDELFEWWSENECDVERRLSWPDMQRQLFEELLETGDALLLRCADPDRARSIPLCYQALEAEQLDAMKDQLPGAGRNEIKRGIEFDRRGRRAAYWLFSAHPSDPHAAFSTRSIRVPAERVIHFTLPGRPSQTRGVGLYNAIIQSARDLDNYLGSELTSATIASLFTVVHKTKTPGTGMGFVGDGSETDASDDYGNPLIKLGRGIVSQIPREDDVTPVKVDRPNNKADTFVRLILMLMGMGGGVSRYRLTRDYSGTTYIASRAAHIDDRASFRPLQGYFGRQLCLPVRRDFQLQTAAYGGFSSVSATQFRRQLRRWQRLQLQLPGWEMLDPEKETDAAIARIGAGLSTLEEECAARGKNWRRVILQRKREQDFAAEHGVTLNLMRPSTAGQGGQAEPEPVAEE